MYYAIEQIGENGMLETARMLTIAANYGIDTALEIEHENGAVSVYLCVAKDGVNHFYQQGEGFNQGLFYWDFSIELDRPKNKEEWKELLESLLTDN